MGRLVTGCAATVVQTVVVATAVLFMCGLVVAAIQGAVWLLTFLLIGG